MKVVHVSFNDKLFNRTTMPIPEVRIYIFVKHTKRRNLSKTKTKNLYSQINHTLQWHREATYKNTTQHIHDK